MFCVFFVRNIRFRLGSQPYCVTRIAWGEQMDWARMLAYITGTVDHDLLLRNEYLVAENQILKAYIKGRLLLSDVEKKTLADIGTDSVERRSKTSLTRLIRIPSWAGIASISPASSMDPSRADIRVDPESTPKSRNSWCVWRKKIPIRTKIVS